MNVVPLLAAEVPTLGERRRRAAAGRRHGRHVEAAAGVTWHDGTPFTSADVKFTVDAINDPSYNPESTDGFDRIASVDTPDPLTADRALQGGLRAVRAAVRPRRACRGTCSTGRDIDRASDYNRAPLGTGPVPRRRVEEPANTSCSSACRATGAATEHRTSGRILFRFIANTNTRINQLKSGEVHVVALVPWDKHREVAAIPGVVVHPRRRQRLRARDAQRAPDRGFRDVRVRRALMHAIDRELIVRYDPRRPGAGRRTGHPAGVVGVHRRRHAVRLRSGAGARRCSTRRAGEADRERHSRRRTARRSPSRSSRRRASRCARASRRRCSGSFAMSAST